MIVVDCSALVMFLTDSGTVGQRVRARVGREDVLHVPYLLDTEIASALLGMARGIRGGTPKLSQTELEHHVKTLEKIPLRRHATGPLLPRIRVLHANLSAYDATYVALAETLGVPLVTTDARIKRGAPSTRCPIEVITAD